MKKFVKVSAITSLVLVTLGVILFVVGAFGGGTKSIWQLASQGRLSFGHWNWHLFDWAEDWHVNYDIDDITIFDEDRSIAEGNAVFTAEKNEVSSLDMELGGCDVYVLSSDSGQFEIKVNGSGKYQSYVENGTLYVKGIRKSYHRGNCEVYVYIPRDAVLNSAEIELGAGQMDLDYLAAADVRLEVGAGTLDAGYLKAADVFAEAGAGEILVEDGEMGNLDIRVGAGRMEMRGTVTGNVNAEVAMGGLYVEVYGSGENDHNYNVECAAGNVTVGGRSFAGLGVERNVNNGAATTYDLECSMGELSVLFGE